MSLKHTVRRAALAAGFEFTRVQRAPDGRALYSGVEGRIAHLLDQARVTTGFCVDIAAADGKQGSNTYALFQAGWTGLAVEADEWMFERLAINYSHLAGVRLFRGLVTPFNVVALLQAADAPPTFGFLSLDIDGYDHDVLGALLSEYRPQLMCVEINEKIPPPIRFTVPYSPDFVFQGACHGLSASALSDLAEAHGYVLVDLWYNNAFLAPVDSDLDAVSVADAYRRGYVDRPDRLEKLPWNRPFEPALTMTPEDAIRFLDDRPELAPYRRFYRMGLTSD